MNQPLFAFALGIATFIASVGGHAQDFSFQSQDEKDLFTYWEHSKTLNRGILECLLIAEGMSDQLDRNREWLAKLEVEVKENIDADDSNLKKGENLYKFVHDRVLRKYSGEASATKLMTSGEFSCVTATALYYHLGTIVGLPVMFHVTPFHVCPILDIRGRKIWVELTQPKGGFDVEYDQEKLVDLLLENKLVTKGELDQKGQETVYNEFIHGHYQDSVAAILGYHYYNCALNLDRLGKSEETFWALAKARSLEREDEAIARVFDVSFHVVSSLQKLTTPYFKVAKAYFQSRGDDSTVIVDAVSSARVGVENLIQTQRDIGQADSILRMLEGLHFSTDLLRRPLAELRQSVFVNKGLDLNRKGRYQEAYATISTELKRDSLNAKLQDIYVQVGMDYVQKLLTSGNDDLAIATVDSMYRRMPFYEKLRDSYARIMVASMMATGKYRASPAKAREGLIKVFEMDSMNTYVREALASVHHELAMNEIRKGNWRSAEGRILEGLRFVPNHEYLKSDLDLLRKEIPRSKK